MRKAEDIVASIEAHINRNHETGLFYAGTKSGLITVDSNSLMALVYACLGNSPEADRLVEALEKRVGFDDRTGLILAVTYPQPIVTAQANLLYALALSELRDKDKARQILQAIERHIGVSEHGEFICKPEEDVSPTVTNVSAALLMLTLGEFEKAIGQLSIIKRRGMTDCTWLDGLTDIHESQNAPPAAGALLSAFYRRLFHFLDSAEGKTWIEQKALMQKAAENAYYGQHISKRTILTPPQAWLEVDLSSKLWGGRSTLLELGKARHRAKKLIDIPEADFDKDTGLLLRLEGDFYAGYHHASNGNLLDNAALALAYLARDRKF